MNNNHNVENLPKSTEHKLQELQKKLEEMDRKLAILISNFSRLEQTNLNVPPWDMT